MGCAEGFVQIQVNKVESHIPWSCPTQHAVKICAIAVHKPTHTMYELCNAQDVFSNLPRVLGLVSMKTAV